MFALTQGRIFLRAGRGGKSGKSITFFTGENHERALAGELARVLVLYRFTDDKDVFRTFYHRALAKRLLLEKSASDDFEKAVLKRLKERECRCLLGVVRGARKIHLMRVFASRV